MDTKKIAIAVLGLAIIGAAIWQFSPNDQADPTNDSAVQPQQRETVMNDTTGQDTTMETAEYADGTYEATGNYTSPAQEEEVAIVITLTDGVVSAAEFEGKGTHETTKIMQGKFSEGFSEEVVGMPVDQIALTTVNGSSLTPQGFMDALEKVKQEASQS